MCRNDATELTFESMPDDPLIRMVMDSDNVTTATFMALIERTRYAVAGSGQRKIPPLHRMEGCVHGL